ncbi:unnamed protein product [Darwinula stevensoni]|uniref:Uncharacterized protein n=1 Tax=Darwinula stevensoni TaxID=69355 RepID=A0A7R9A6Z4_9CRUS|nr:unnamed protein product [Darwinula stevensoni]CAG0890826.1 unnamed protein product [Darwinula stevensoni]
MDSEIPKDSLRKCKEEKAEGRTNDEQHSKKKEDHSLTGTGTTSETKRRNNKQPHREGTQKKQQKEPHDCKESQKLAHVRQLEKFDKNPREQMKVRLDGDTVFSFTEGAKMYQEKYYADTERAYAFPAGYVLKEKEQERLFRKTQDFKPDGGGREPRIKPADLAVATVFHMMKEVFSGFPSLVIYDYEFKVTFYTAMGIKNAARQKRAEESWKKKGFEVTDGDHDVMAIIFEGSRVLVLFFEVKAREIVDNELRDNVVGKAEGQLRKSERVFRQFVEATASSPTFQCSFVALPYLSRRDVAKALDCSCSENILTKDDLESEDSFWRFLASHGIALTMHDERDPVAHECYLDVMKTYVAASASVDGMPRTDEELRKNIGQRMQTALELLTPRQMNILEKEPSVLFLAGGQGAGKTYLLLKRAQKLAERRETVIFVNMSDGELTGYIKMWLVSKELEDYVKILDSKELRGGRQHEIIDSLLDMMNAQKHAHFLIDEMQINIEMNEKDPEEIGRIWKELAESKKCRSIWIVWRPSDVMYPENLDIQTVIEIVCQERVEMLTEIKRNTKYVGEFVVEVTRFIQKSLPCFTYLPMRGLEYGRTEDLGLKKRMAQVIFIQTPPDYNWAFLWVPDVARTIQSSLKNSRHLTIITRTFQERDIVVRELGGRGKQRVTFLDSNGMFRGHPQSTFLVFYHDQVTGMSFDDLILLDDGNTFYRSWSRMVSMARRSLHVITMGPLPSGHWDEPEQIGLVSSCPFRTSGLPNNDDLYEPLDECSYPQTSWNLEFQPFDFSPSDHEAEAKSIELIFGPNRSGKTCFLVHRVKRLAEQEYEEVRRDSVEKHEETSPSDRRPKQWLVFVDCSRWNRSVHPRSLSLVIMKEEMKRAGLENTIELFDIHDLLKQFPGGGNLHTLSPRLLEQLALKMLEKGEEEGRTLHVAFDDAPIHSYVIGYADTEGSREEWESVLGVLSSRLQDSLASLTIAFQPYVQYSTATFDVKEFMKILQHSPRTGVRIMKNGCKDVGFPHLLEYVLSHESPKELRVKLGTLNTRSQPSSLVFGEKPIIITPPLEAHYHGGFKCIGGRGRGCVAVTAAAYLLSHRYDNVAVLISDDEILEDFTDALERMTNVPTTGERLKIYHPRNYRGCENPEVMCIGVEDSWVVEGISRAVQTLFIVDCGTNPAVHSRMRLWREMERRGLILHRPQASSPALDSLSQDDWKALNQKSPFLKRIFAMGKGEYGPSGVWEVTQPHKNLWVQVPTGTADVFLAHKDRLIHCKGGEVHIFHLQGKDPNESPYGWDEVLHIPRPFFILGSTGTIVQESLFLFGGAGNSQEVRSLDLGSEKWMPLSPMRNKRLFAASVMWDPHTVLVMGGANPEARGPISNCECFDTRTAEWIPFPHHFPVSLHSYAATIYNDHVYISGGIGGDETRGQVWRFSVKGGEAWETLPSLNMKRQHHGMIGDKGRLFVLGGTQRRGNEDIMVLEMETLALDGRRRWVTEEKFPFKNIFKATEMKSWSPSAVFEKDSAKILETSSKRNVFKRNMVIESGVRGSPESYQEKYLEMLSAKVAMFGEVRKRDLCDRQQEVRPIVIVDSKVKTPLNYSGLRPHADEGASGSSSCVPVVRWRTTVTTVPLIVRTVLCGSCVKARHGFTRAVSASTHFGSRRPTAEGLLREGGSA